jgi:hypothetical protein
LSFSKFLFRQRGLIESWKIYSPNVYAAEDVTNIRKKCSRWGDGLPSCVSSFRTCLSCLSKAAWFYKLSIVGPKIYPCQSDKEFSYLCLLLFPMLKVEKLKCKKSRFVTKVKYTCKYREMAAQNLNSCSAL